MGAGMNHEPSQKIRPRELKINRDCPRFPAVVRIFKSITARELFRQFPALKKELWGGEFWSDGFYIATVSERGNWKAVEQYVANQGKTMEGTPPQLRLFD
jgi:hypothetical protein